MSRLLALAALALAATGPVGAQQPADSSPVRAELRVQDGRTSFKSGEPIRLELLLSSTVQGFVVESGGLDHAEDEIRVTPETGVIRFPKYGWRDSFGWSALDRPSRLRLVANYWMRFDRSGDYTITVTTKRVRQAGKDGWPGGGEPAIPLTTNAVKLHVDVPTPEEERTLIGNAVVALQNAASQDLEAQISAAEQLAFLGGDDAALEKYRQLRTISPSLSNARSILRRGFFMSRRPAVILEAVERDLDDLSKPVTWDTIADAMALRDFIEKRPVQPSGMVMPAPPDDQEVDPYIERVRSSIANRRGESRRFTALSLFTNSRGKWADVREIVLAEMSLMPVDTRAWLLSSYTDQLQSPDLVPAILKTIEETKPQQWNPLLTQLAKLDPKAAVAPFVDAIANPAVSMLYDAVEKMPPDSLTGATRGLMDAIQTLLAKKSGRDFTFQQKVVLLPLVADRSIVAEVRGLYDQHATSFDSDAAGGLLGYLLKWDDEAAISRLRAALEREGNSRLLEQATRYAYSPKLDAIFQERLFADDLDVSANAAYVLRRAKRPNLQGLLETRLQRWQSGRRLTMASVPLTQREGYYESELVSQIANRPEPKFTSNELEALLASCLTDACRIALRR